jgi:hypothetical protein
MIGKRDGRRDREEERERKQGRGERQLDDNITVSLL